MSVHAVLAAGLPTIINLTISSNTSNVNLYTLAGNPVAFSPIVNLTINTSITVKSTSVSTAALDIGTSWAGVPKFNLIVNGNLKGKGGNGGAQSNPGQAGGDAINARGYALTIDNTNGNVWGGGGGGGAGDNGSALGGGGGGGAGEDAGSGGSATGGGGGCGSDAQSGSSGTATTGGAAGAGASCGTPGGPCGKGCTPGCDGCGSGSTGGAGGVPGAAGSAGGGGTYAGGAAGKAVALNGGSVTWLGGNNGTQVKGAVS